MQNVILMGVIGTLALLTGCSSTEPERFKKEEVLDPTLANIKQLIGEPKASSLSFCQLIEVGIRACGGPQQYLVYSSESIKDEQALLKMVKQYNQQSLKSGRGDVSTCQFTPEPEIVLQGGLCRAKP